MNGRLFLYPKDLVILTGKSIDTCREMYNLLLTTLGKTKLQGLSIIDYSKYTEIPIEEIKKVLK
jgi:hypothetical protein